MLLNRMVVKAGAYPVSNVWEYHPKLGKRWHYTWEEMEQTNQTLPKELAQKDWRRRIHYNLSISLTDEWIVDFFLNTWKLVILWIKCPVWEVSNRYLVSYDDIMKFPVYVALSSFYVKSTLQPLRFRIRLSLHVNEATKPKCKDRTRWFSFFLISCIAIALRNYIQKLIHADRYIPTTVLRTTKRQLRL